MRKIYFATNRNPDQRKSPGAFGRSFNPDGMACLRFGWATRQGRKIIIRTARERLRPNSEGTREDPGYCRYGSLEVFTGLQADMSARQRDTLVFIHGYNHSFRDALRRGFKLAELFPAMNILVFSWPSDGSMAPWLAYASDRHDAAASGPALGRGLLKLSDFLCEVSQQRDCQQRVHLLAHSMGVYVLRHALQYYRQRQGGLLQILGEVALLAADEDSDAFEHDYKLGLLSALCRRVSVYFNRDDRAMAISDLTKGNPERLGQNGARLPYAIPAKVSQVDVGQVVDETVGHNYYRNNAAVIEDLRAVFSGLPQDRIEGRQYRSDTNRYILQTTK